MNEISFRLSASKVTYHCNGCNEEVIDYRFSLSIGGYLLDICTDCKETLKRFLGITV